MMQQFLRGRMSKKYTLFMVALLVSSLSVAGGHRSYTAKSEFKRMSPCPSTGERRGACPGYQIDHVTPLKCHGADRPYNMQWLSIEDHKAKTRREAMLCRK